MKKTTHLSNRTLYWLLAVSASIIIIGFVTFTQWQSYRYPVDNSLRQAIKGVVPALESGTPAKSLSSISQPVNPKEDSGVFVIATNEKGTVQGSTLQVGGNSPAPGQDVLEKAKDGQTTATWNVEGQPVALVIEHYKGKKPGYVMVGQSLKEVREQQNTVLMYAGIALLLMVIISSLAVRVGREKTKSPVTQAKEALKKAETKAVATGESESSAIKNETKKSSSKKKRK